MTNRQTRHWIQEAIPIRLTLLLMLALLAGCATEGKVLPQPVVETPDVPEETTVTRFDDGRKGFLITEVVGLDGAVRRDFDQAVVYLHNQDFAPAVELLEKVVETLPELTAPYINLALAYQKIDQPEPAEEYLKIALEMIPGHPLASHQYGLLLRKSGRFAEARNIYEQSLVKFPEYRPIHRNLGILCDIYLGDQECAITQYKLYNETGREDQQVKLWISDLQMRFGL
ncbi:MAG: hypothetical protein U9Q61_00285 [Thermodesulfobacteriota bacterium]|nr:hypothetical protein [Thermodesulfobacteriota bacterium]